MSPYFEEISYKQEETAVAGTEVRFDCNVSGNPEPRVSRLSVPVGHSLTEQSYRAGLVAPK